MAKLLSYEEKGTWIHRLSGITKLIFFLIWCALSALTYDTRILLVMILISLIAFACSWRKAALSALTSVSESSVGWLSW